MSKSLSSSPTRPHPMKARGRLQRMKIYLYGRAVLHGGAVLHGLLGYAIAKKACLLMGIALPLRAEVWLVLLASPGSTFAWYQALDRWCVRPRDSGIR